MISEATAATVTARLTSADWVLKSEVMGAAVLAQNDEHFWRLIGVATPDVVKVGPKGYIHGWIFVGAPGVGARVFHPQHGMGTVTKHDGTHATVKFDKTGATHTFEAREHTAKGRLTTRGDHAKTLADRAVKDPKGIGKLSDAELKDTDAEFGRRATALGKDGQVSRTHRQVKDELARRGGAAGGKVPTVDQEKEKTYKDLSDAAFRYNATTAQDKNGHRSLNYIDPDKQQEAIRLHTAARRAAPDAKSKQRHTDAINLHKGYLRQIENNRNIADFEQGRQDTEAKLKAVERGHALATAKGQDEAAKLNDHLADLHEKRGKELTARGGGGQNGHDTAAQRYRGRADFHRQQAEQAREEQAARKKAISERIPQAEKIVDEREAKARQSGAKADLESAIGGHEEIARQARGIGQDDVADKHDAAAAKLRDELDRQKEGGAALAARDKVMQRRKGLEIKQAQRYLDAMDKNPELPGGPKQRAALREASNASIATAGRGGTTKAHEAAAAAYRRYADAAEEAGDKQSADIARGQIARFHDEMAAHVRERRAAGAKLREGFTGGGKKPSKSKVPGLTEEGAKEPKIKTPWGTMHPADMLISHPGSATYSADAARSAMRELDRRGATPHGMDKVSRARREAAKELDQHEKWAKEAAKPGGYNDYYKAVADAKQADADAEAKGTADAHQAAADAHRKAVTLAYTNDYNAASFHRQMTDLHQRSANQKRAEETAKTPPKAAAPPKAPKPPRATPPKAPKEATPDSLSAKANRTGAREDHVKASVAQHQAGNRAKAEKHRSAVASIDASNEYKTEAEQHADAADRTQDPDLHKAAAESYRSAAEHMDDVPGGKKAAADLRGQADEHDNIAQRIVHATANYVKSFLHANRTGHKADKKGTADAHRAAADAENEAAARAITAPQRRHHAAEAARHMKAVEAIDAKTSVNA